MTSQTLRATRFALLSFRRNPASTFFTVVFPLIILLLFGFIFRDDVTDSGAEVATFQVPGILAMAIVSATFVNLAMTAVFRREAGQLKRLRGTPMRPLIWIGAQTLASLVIVAIMTLLVTVVGRLFFGVAFNLDYLGIFVTTIALGSLAFSALGLAVAAIIPNEDAAPAITNAAVLPLYFVSDVFLAVGDEGFISWIGDLFPIKPLAQALQPAYNPFVETIDIPWSQWLVIAVWGLVGVVAAARLFRWTPAADRG